ncbi:MAG TPA: hypothetical protein VFV98_00825 [Vicinamibacterales bacterium]|nr:hypothetical protein [Vicinamibacterales bacterium]
MSLLSAAICLAALLGAQEQTPAPAPPLSPPKTASPVSSVDAGPPYQLSPEVGVRFLSVPEQDANDLRFWAAVRLADEPTDWLRWNSDVRFDGLVADRRGRVNDFRVEARDVWIEMRRGPVDLRAGFGRLPWGRLDEVQPTDLINPLDTSRLLLDGRSEARRAVGFVRARVTSSEALRFEGVLVPFFRRGVFDALDEDTSPFNLTRDLVLPAFAVDGRVEHREPDVRWENVSGGGRVDATVGRVDVGVAAYRGFDAFGPIVFETTITPAAPPDVLPSVVGHLVEFHPRFTMLGGDFETVTGDWAWRGEAAIVDRQFAGAARPGPVAGRSLDAGAGFDRRAGDFRVYGSLLVHHDWSDVDPAIVKTDTSVVGSIERLFDRERWLARAFALVNPADRSGFVRGLVTWKPRDFLAVDFSAGAFLGSGDDTISRVQGRDFVLIGVRAF